MNDWVFEGATIVTPNEVLRDAWLHVSEDRIVGLGRGEPPSGPCIRQVDSSNRTIVPGFLDLHCHGGSGRSLYSGERDDARVVAASHLRRGTTGMLASIGTTALPQMLKAARAISAVIEDGTAPNILGIHFEGPFLSSRRRGAQTLTALREPNVSTMNELIDAADGHALSMTIAPELPGAIEIITAFRDHIVFSIGHTDATAEQFTAAVDAGARQVTHLFNAMPPVHHRAPGPVARALLDDRVVSELILDGEHLADDTVRLAMAIAGSARLILVTDAMPAAGLGDGEFSFADRAVVVRKSVAHLRGTTTLAGSTLFLARAVDRAVRHLQVPLSDAVRISATNAARLMGWQDRGELRVGARADLVILGADGALTMVIHDGIDVLR